MLEHLGESAAGLAVEQAVRTAVDRGRCTKDVGGALGTRATGDAVASLLGEGA